MMLCDPVTYSGMQPALVMFPMGPGQVLTLHYLSTDNDLEALYEKFLQHSLGQWDLDGLLERFKTSYHYIAVSSTSQAFMLNVNNQPIFEIEIHKATAHQLLPKDYTPLPNDFIIQIAAGDWNNTTPAQYIESIRRCLQYFFAYQEVQRILIDGSLLTPAAMQTILMPAGFYSIPGQPNIYVRHP